MKFIFVAVAFLASMSNADAQKSKYVGHYLMGKPNRDTLDGHLFMSVDSFKFVYQALIKEGKDYAYPVYKGTWTVDGNNNVTFKYKDGRIGKAVLSLRSFGTASLLRITMGNNVYTRSPTEDQMHELHH